MRRSLRILTLLTILFLAFLIPKKSEATHAMGIDIAWECLGGNQYRFTMNFFRDCDGVPAPASISIQLNSASCAASTSVFCTLIGGAGVEISPLCPTQLPNSSCGSGSLPGVEQYTYQGTVTLPASCNDWVVSYDECCRNSTITNLVNPSAQSALVTGVLDNTVSPCNSSPVFTSFPIPYICVNQPFCYNIGAVDPDGDSLAYALVSPLDGPRTGTPPYGTPIGFTGGLSATNPITSTGFSFDPVTGSMCFTPTAVQKAVISFRVEEWRNGVLIGYNTRDIQIVVQNCVNIQPTLTPRDYANLTGGVRIDSNSIEICPGVPVTFDIIASDANATDSVFLNTNLSSAIPGATFTTSYSNPADTIVGSFSWTPTAADTGFYNFTVTISDNGCPILGAQIFNFDIYVIPSTEATPDTSYYCVAGAPIQINTIGGTAFTWNTLSGDAGGLSCFNCANPLASPNTTSVYEVVSNLSAVCKNRDTIVVNFVPSFVLDAGNDTTICQNGLAQLNASATPGAQGPFTFSWSPADSLSNTTIPNPSANPQDSTSYVLTTTSAAGCTILDTVEVNVNGTAPQVTILPVDTVCAGSSFTFQTVISQSCGTTANPCTGPTQSGQVGAITGSFSDVLSPAYVTGSARTNRQQFIYLRSELDAMGFVGGGRINALVLHFPAAGGTAVPDLEIKMGCTSDAQFGTLNFYPGLATVRAAAPLNPATGGQIVNLTTPYIWDGQSNLIVEFCTTTPTSGTTSPISTITGAGNRTLFTTTTVGGACGLASGGLSSNLPVMGFQWCEAIPPGLSFSWNPTAGLNNSTIPEPTATPGATTTYTISVDDGFCVGSDAVTLEVAPTFAIDAGNDTTLCRNLPLQMNGFANPAAGPFTYLWSPGYAGVSDSLISNPFISAPDTTTYYFYAKSAAGCELVDSVTINIDGISPLVELGINDTICPGDIANLSTLVSQPCGATTDPCTGAQTLNTVGDSLSSPGGSGVFSPFYNNPGLGQTSKHQYIVTAAELNSMGFSGGRIDQIGFKITSAGPFATTDFSVSMGCTTDSVFNATTRAFATGLVNVFNSGTFTPTTGQNLITLTPAFNWDGTSNLVIETCFNSAQTAGNDAICVEHGPIGGPDLSNTKIIQPNVCAAVTGDFVQPFRPVIWFRFCQSTPVGLTYTWSPTAGLNNASIPNPTASPTQTTQYSIVVSDGGPCSGGDFITVAIDSTNFVEALADTIVICPGDSAILDGLVSGPPIPATLASCGVNGTPCTQTAYQISLDAGGASGSTVSPLRGGFQDARLQTLVKASDIIALGGSSGILMNMSMNITSILSSQPYDNFNISLGCTGANTLTVGAWLPTQLVYSASNYTPSLGWNTFNFNFPFDWDGTSNIVVEFCFDNTTATGTDQISDRTPTPAYTATVFAQNSGGNNGCTIANSSSFSGSAPDLRFTICNPEPNQFSYTWSPALGLNDPNILSPTAQPASTTTYTLTVSGGTCDVSDTITLTVPGACPLPLDGLTLVGERVNQMHSLVFSSLNERSMDRYLIERAGEDKNWAVIGSENAVGNSSGKTDYDFNDIYPMHGLNWYRVRAIDQNGKVEFSNEIVLVYTGESAISGLYPNPVQGGNSLILDYYSAEDETINLQITDMLGRTLTTKQVPMNAGSNRYEISTADLPAGSYFVRVRNAHRLLSKKVVVIR